MIGAGTIGVGVFLVAGVGAGRLIVGVLVFRGRYVGRVFLVKAVPGNWRGVSVWRVGARDDWSAGC